MYCLPHRRYAGVVRWVAACSISLTVLSCSGSHESRRVPPSPVGHVRVAPTADVPALLDISIDELQQRLGPPQPLPGQFMASEAGVLLHASQGRLDSLVAFRTGGLQVLATYNTRSRQVRDLLLLGHHEDSLMGRARLRSNTADYLVMPVFRDNRSFRLLGLRVIPVK